MRCELKRSFASLESSSYGQRGERGTILILTLVMLTVMSLLGVLALNTSDTELRISSNYRAQQEAFYAADRTIEYAMTNPDIYNSIGMGEEPLDAHASALAAGMGGLKTGAGNKVKYLSAGALPPGSGSDPSYFQARYYLIQVTGEGPNGSTSRIAAQVARIVPK